MPLKRLRTNLYVMLDECADPVAVFHQFNVFRRLARFARLGINNPTHLLPLRKSPFPGEAAILNFLAEASIDERKEAAHVLGLVRNILSERHCASTNRLRGEIETALRAEARVEANYLLLPAKWRW
jgi:hypothetical protein